MPIPRHRRKVQRVKSLAEVVSDFIGSGDLLLVHQSPYIVLFRPRHREQFPVIGTGGVLGHHAVVHDADLEAARKTLGPGRRVLSVSQFVALNDEPVSPIGDIPATVRQTPAGSPEGTYFDEEVARQHIDFLEAIVTLTKTTKSGRPERLTVLPVHRELIEGCVGWMMPEGLRLRRKAFFSVARKNGKSFCAAMVGLCQLMFDSESSPEVYLAAVDKDQASVVYRACVEIVSASPELSALLRIIPSKKEILNAANNGRLKALSSEGKGKHGLNPSCVILDELHGWTTSREELFRALTTGSGARRQPLTIIITTAGVDEESLCGREYDYACKIRDGLLVDPAYLSMIFELPKDADWADESVWHLANPTLGEIIKMQSLRADCAKAKAVPSEQAGFRRFGLNQWTQTLDIWISTYAFDLCKLTPKKSIADEIAERTKDVNA